MGPGGVGGEGDRRDDGKVKLGSGNAAVVGGQRHGRELLRGRVRPAGGLVESEGRSIGPLAGHLLWAPPPREWRPVPRPTWEEWYEGDKRKGGGGEEAHEDGARLDPNPACASVTAAPRAPAPPPLPPPPRLASPKMHRHRPVAAVGSRCCSCAAGEAA